jgi:uncharacterized caspase-like protein
MLCKLANQTSLRAIATTGILLALQVSGASTTRAAVENANDFLVVDCMLPGQVRRLGTGMTYLTARRAIRTSAVDCGIRGGEHVAYDRADYRTALKVWLPKAKEGDPEAMTNVGEIYEKGLGLSPDYEVAAYWYAKAAEDDFARAQINLGYMYEMGIGVERNPRTALDWYRKASGFDATLDLTPSSVPSSGDTQVDSELVGRLQQELAQLKQASTQLRSDLDYAHSVLSKSESEKREQALPFIQTPRIIVKPDPRTAHELTNVQTTLAQREQEVSELDALLSQTRLQLADTQQTLSERQQEVDEKQNTIQQTLFSSDAKQAEVDLLAAKLKEKEAAANATSKQQEQELQQREVALKSLETELLQRREEVADRTERIKSLQEKVVELEAIRAKRDANETVVLASAQGLMAGPEVTMIEPVLPLTRGEQTIVLRSDVSSRQVIGRLTAPAGVLKLMINDTVTKTNPQGVFASKVIMAGPSNPVSIVAVDNQGKRSAVNFSFAYETTVSEPATAESVMESIMSDYRNIKFGKYYALVIGNNNYQTLTDLKTAVNDAEKLVEVLERRYSVDTTLLIDANRYQILSALNEMRGKLTSADNLLIFYAGHGVLDEVNMRGHWLPVDAEAENTANWISNISITDTLNVIPAKQILVISDSCYSGSLTRSATPRLTVGRTTKERLNWLRTMSSKRARMVMTSGGLKPVLDSGGGKHSIFTKALLEVLESNMDVLEGQRLHKEVAAKVAFSAAQIGFDQVPEYSPIRFAGHESGEFFLVPNI